MALPLAPVGLRSPIVPVRSEPSPPPRPSPVSGPTDVFEPSQSSVGRSEADQLLDGAVETATGKLNGFKPEGGTDALEGPRGGRKDKAQRHPKTGRRTEYEVGGEARTRTTQRVEREGDQDVYRQSQEAKGVIGAKVAVRGRVGAGQEKELTRSVDVELRVPAGTKREDVPTSHSALNDPRRMPDGAQLRIKGSVTDKLQEGLEVPVGPIGVGFDASIENGSSSELRVRRNGNFAEVTRIDEKRTTSTDRAGVSVGAMRKLGGVTVAEAKGGGEVQYSSRTERSARFDLSTQEGRAAYERFVRTREVPQVAAPGVEPLGEKKVVRVANGQVGSVEGHTPTQSHKLEGRDEHQVTELTEARAPDGTAETTFRTAAPGGTEVTGTTRDGATNYQVRIEKPDADTLKLLEAAFPGGVQRGADGSVTLSLSAAELKKVGGQVFPFTRDQPNVDARTFARLIARLKPADFAAKALQGKDAAALPAE